MPLPITISPKFTITVELSDIPLILEYVGKLPRGVSVPQCSVRVLVDGGCQAFTDGRIEITGDLPTI